MRWGTSFLRDWVVELHRALGPLQAFVDTWTLAVELPVIILESGALVKPPILLVSVCPWRPHQTIVGPVTPSTGLPNAVATARVSGIALVSLRICAATEF